MFGALLGGGLGIGSAFMQNEFNRKAASDQRDWSKMMSDTAHRREVRDLELAGLNPALSAMGGAGAAVPGSQAQQVADFQQPINSAMAATRLRSEVDLNKAHVDLLGAQTEGAKATAELAAIEARRKRNEFRSIDVKDPGLTGALESLPSVIRGPLRALIGASNLAGRNSAKGETPGQRYTRVLGELRKPSVSKKKSWFGAKEVGYLR